ncbi:MAG TPA: hypothetical protein VFH61_13635, partial [Thermoleophilia bacterium]|nr:hypothetical protein [Thermoleophilia bacterium]
MSTSLYPTQLASHPNPGALMAYRDGVFGQRPQAPYGQDLSAFQNGVFGPALGRGLGTVNQGSLLDA